MGMKGGSGDFSTIDDAGTIWKSIVRIGVELDSKGLEFSKSFGKKIEDGAKTKLWTERWRGNRTF